MDECPVGVRPRFPWGYAAAVVVPLVVVAALAAAERTYGTRYTMEPGMALSLLLPPYFAIVIGWGVWRLQRGEGSTFPALRWLVWLPAALLVLAVIGS